MNNKNEKILKLVSVDTFYEERPAMTIFTQEQVLECILSSFNLINGECANLPWKVLDYNIEGAPVIDNVYYRNEFEMDQFKQAIITQTQYSLNLGNDYSQGSTTFASGGISASIQRPHDRDILAPGVTKFLTNARLYELQVYTNLQAPKTDCKQTQYLTYETGDQRYVEKYQENGTTGNICVIDENKMVSFVTPNNITFKGYQADKILDTDGQYKFIQNIANLAFFGPNGTNAATKDEITSEIKAFNYYDINWVYDSGDIVATYCEVKNGLRYWKSLKDNNKGNNPVLSNNNSWLEIRADIVDFTDKILDPQTNTYKKINEFNVEYFGGMTTEQIYSAINASGTTWNADVNYKKGFVVIFVDSNNSLGWYESLQDDNKGNNPETSKGYWKQLPPQTIDVNDIIAQITPYLDQEITKKVDNAIDTYKTNSDIVYQNTTFKFNDSQTFNQFLQNNPELNADMFEDVPNDYYTKQEADNKFGDKATQETNSTNIVNLENTKANKSEVYSKNEVYTKTESDNRFAKLNEHNTFTKPQTVLGNANNPYPAINVRGAKQTDSAVNIYTNNENNNGVIQNKAGGVIEYRSAADPVNNTDVANKAYVDNAVKNMPTVDLTNYYTKSESDNKYAKLNENNLFYGTQMVIGNLDIKGSGGNASNYARFFNFDYNNQNFTALKFINNGKNKLQIQTNNTSGESIISTGGENVLTISNLKNPTSSNDATNKGYVDTNFATKSYVDNKFGSIRPTYFQKAVVEWSYLQWEKGGASWGRFDVYSWWHDNTVVRDKEIISCTYKPNNESVGQNILFSWFKGYSKVFFMFRNMVTDSSQDFAGTITVWYKE